MSEHAEGCRRDDSRLTDSELVRKLLWDCFPEKRKEILDLEEGYVTPEDPSPKLGAYTLASEIFVESVLTPLLDATPVIDDELAKRCSVFLELLLGSGRPFLKEMTSIRITDHLLGYPGNWMIFQKYAGNLLLCEVRERRPYYKGPFSDLE
ncbi:hypothetical protein [Streptomyces sp. NPDC050804]|uniref:hypothetical protein n=1 Tax=Streptomyces sp. NPDC050804 TaxID=3154745 RepID=UPI003432E757